MKSRSKPRRRCGAVGDAGRNQPLSDLSRLGVALLSGAMLAGCTQGDQSLLTDKAPASSAGAFAASGPAAYRSGVAGAPPSVREANRAENDVDYRIAARDILQVNVFQVPDLSRTAQVNSDGMIVLPLIGRVPVAGKSIDQAQSDIAQRLGKTYLRSPQVSVALVKSGQRVTINGAVKNPVVTTIDGQLTLSQAVTFAGGANELANPNRVHVARTTDQTVNDQVYNLDAIQAGREADPVLSGGDIVIVEESNAKVAVKNVKDLLPFAILGSFLSDRRAKTGIARLRRLPGGLALYRFRYRGDRVWRVGVMAQEVQRVLPAAVFEGPDGYLRVNYQRLGFMPQTWKAWRRAHAHRSRDREACSIGQG